MNCRICNKAIVLVPSARERAARFGGTPEFYTRLFTTHGTCQVAERQRAAAQLGMPERKITQTGIVGHDAEHYGITIDESELEDIQDVKGGGR